MRWGWDGGWGWGVYVVYDPLIAHLICGKLGQIADLIQNGIFAHVYSIPVLRRDKGSGGPFRKIFKIAEKQVYIV